MTVDLVLSNTKAYLNNEIVACSLAIEKGKIHKIGKEASMPKADEKMDLKGFVVLPGLIDVHVHLRDEGKAYKEDFYTGTAAAAAGGITTVLDMPNNNPVTMSTETLKNRMEIAANKILVNVGFYSEFPKDMTETADIAKDAVAFKLYMAEQIGGLNIDDDNALLNAFKNVGKLRVPVAVHAEDKSSIKKAEDKFKCANRNDVKAFLKVHCEIAETKAIKRLLGIIKQANLQLHFCHVSTADGLKVIVEGKKSGLPITCEVTPHHLFLSVEELSQIGTLALTMPPVREKWHTAALWDGIKNGLVDVVASDHASHALHEKKAEVIWNVKVGIPGLETMLPLLLTEVKRGRLSLTEVVRLLSEKPAEIFKLKDRGCLKERNFADLTVVDLKRKYRIDASNFHSKAKYSPFDGWTVEGKPVKTFVKGQLVMDEDEIVAEAGSGEIVRREQP